MADKQELEFTSIAEIEWTPAHPDVPEGLDHKILAQEGEGGPVTRILRFAPGVDTSPGGVQVHDFWEEVYVLEGSIRDLRLNQEFTAGHFACRPPGMPHGPWISPEGCLTFEVRYTR